MSPGPNLQLFTRLPYGPYSGRILLLQSSISSSDWTMMCQDPAIPCSHQLNLGLLINLGVGKRLEKVWVFNFCWLPHRVLLKLYPEAAVHFVQNILRLLRANGHYVAPAFPA
ncbi:hypothetical protein BHE74_00019215 [Ensete ventricosum]|nr:hypothetical protein BHE74_00019215 [Ensete ventricosum]